MGYLFIEMHALRVLAVIAIVAKKIVIEILYWTVVLCNNLITCSPKTFDGLPDMFHGSCWHLPGQFYGITRTH